MCTKTFLPILFLLATAALPAQAQLEQSGATAPAAAATAPTTGAGNPAPGVGSAYSVVARGADHRVWQRVEWEPTRSGRNIPHVHSYTELSTGMHYLQNGQWLESKEEIEIVENGAVARQGPHKVAFAANINSPVSVEVLTPDNKRLKIRPLGLAYYDFHTGNQVLIAELKDSEGLLVGTNQVLYPDAFTDFRADVRYSYMKSGLEQDVILRQIPPLPETYGLNPTTTWLLVLTEFIDPPPDVQVDRRVRRGWKESTVDRVTDFGAMKIVPGTAFSLNAGENRRKGVPVQKHWTVLDGRTFLIEEVSFSRIAPRLRALHASVRPSTVGNALLAKHVPGKTLSLPAASTASASRSGKVQVASAAPDRNGLVVDFDLESGNDIVLQGDTTYLVSGDVNLTGTTTIEGGTVIKFSPGTSINLFGPVKCLTGPYSPAVLTALDDDTVGETISGSSGNPSGWYASCALACLWGGADLRYLNIRYAYGGVFFYNGDFALSHSQFGLCYSALLCETANFTNCNVLMHNVEVPFDLDYSHGRVEHLTCDQARVLADDYWFTYWWSCPENPASSSLTLVNSLTASITNGYGIIPVTTNHVWNFSNGTGVFQSVGAGAYYLVGGSTNRNAGTTDISAALADALKTRTTYPPVVYSNATVSIATTFSPQAQRDADTPDLGYHYDPLDYTFGGVDANANLTLAPGTAVGWFRTSEGWYRAGHGIHAGDDTTITFNGTLEQPDYWVRCNTVQEQPAYAGYGPGGITGWTYPSINDSPKVIARFTHCSTMASELGAHFRDDYGILRLQAADCEFIGASVGGYNILHALTNCLFSRASIWLQTGESFPSMVIRNCTVHGAGLIFAHWEAGSEHFYTSIKDTIFDGAYIDTGYPDDPSCVDYDYNAFLETGYQTYPQGGNDKLVTDFNWQTSWLGNYYLPTNSPLINTGSVASAASVGLYHYTTQTNQVKETNSVVDIGYHYVALDANGNPVDTDTDGIPDYLEDANGNGTVDSGETDWQSATDLGLKVLITRPKNNSVVP